VRLPFGWHLSRQKSSDVITRFPPSSGGWWPVLREGFSGAWQRGMQTPLTDAATHPTFWGCLTLIAGDIAKMRPMLMKADAHGIETEVANAAYSPVLDQPNHYQDRIQFLMYWMLSKLTRGNTYALKVRDNRNVVTDLYLLDPTRVRPLVSPNGDVYYALYQDQLAGIDEANIVVPAREIIHDRMFPIYHPLVGLSPVYSSGHAAILALEHTQNAMRFAKNGSMLGGLLVAPNQISEQTAKRLEEHWNKNYAGPENAGKIAAIGDGLKFETPDIMTSVDAQIIEQLKWSDEKICATFHVPGYMVQVGSPPLNNNVEALAQQYYSQCLQIHIESIELCLTKGLATEPYEVELDIECLLRMDSLQKMEAATKGVIGGIYTPNEARAMFNLPPTKGGDQVFLQKQNWPLSELGSDAVTPTPAVPAVPAAAPAPQLPAAKSMDADRLLGKVITRMAA
jgi:HK97 family phage portal protein